MTSIPTTRFAVAALAFLALGFTACGSDDDGGGSPFGGGAQDQGDDASDETDGDDDGATDETTGGDTGGGSDTTAAQGGDDSGSSDLGSCHVKVTGAVETEWTTHAGAYSAAYGPWYPEAIRDPSTPPENQLILNCTGESGNDYVGIEANSSGPGVPMQPGTYTLPEGTGGLAADPNDPIDVIIGLNSPNNMAVWDTGPGATVVITEFDENHIAGTFSIPVIDNNAGTGTATVTGEFDFKNPYA